MKKTRFNITAVILLVMALFVSGIMLFSSKNGIAGFAGYNNQATATSFYDYKVLDIYGETFDLATLKGKKVMVVNTASKCGNTPQYEDLERLYKEFGSKGFVVLGFPANNFMNQEPGTNEDIIAFCEANYGVTFPMMDKVSVKGDDMAPLYQWLTRKELNGKMDSSVGWNFQKYLIDENGQLVDMIAPRENPYSEKVLGWLNGSR